MKRVTKIIICICATIILVTGIAVAVIQQNVKLIGTKIAFPELLGGTLDDTITLPLQNYDRSEGTKKVQKEFNKHQFNDFQEY